MINTAMAWAFYYIGHFISLWMNIWPFEFAHPYSLYNWFMVKSHSIQGSGKGPWGPIDNNS